MRRLKRAATLVAAATTFCCGPAAAAGPAQDTPLQVGPGPDIYSGYAVVAPSFTAVTGAWKQPALTCGPPYSGLIGGVRNTIDTGSSMLRVPSLQDDPVSTMGTLFIPHVATWIGMVGMHGPDRTLIQTGTSMLCLLGVPKAYTFFEIPAGHAVTAVTWNTPAAEPGDDMRAGITWDGHSTYRMSISDVTRNWHKDAAYRVDVVPRAALTVFESIPDNVPTFRPVTFTDVTADGRPFGDFHPQTLRIAAPPITPTPLTGTSFTVAGR